ncbi:biopolymer transport protein ExbB [Allopseudospirillum japonicum]|uniref:Biopolymer transport protein ExbB n=2 Tax=Allopseudospirillum japonicum TaxID=64971 RepID=A0A1H6TKI5_9GAMM|nr:MotA/TolQ/ExbB proton channel family protein [Allopseudospirillum japonicum]SEI76725.1 biopolymer transport protein ExbB [Allopseudospirillum japonicum]
MLAMLETGGLLIWPLMICSLLALAIVLERTWVLFIQANRIAPRGLAQGLLRQLQQNPQLQQDLAQGRARTWLNEVAQDSPLGAVLASGLKQVAHGREQSKESIQEAAAHLVHELERFLNMLGTLASITPLLGLLGTVVGMIDVFAQLMLEGTGDARLLAGGISKALVTTAFGLGVAIPALLFHRFFIRRVGDLVVRMEQEAIHLLDELYPAKIANTRGDM